MRDPGLAGLAKIDVEQVGEVAVARVFGEIDLSNAPAFARVLKGAVPPGASGLVIDLSRAVYIDSAGIRELFAVNRHLVQRRQELRLVAPEDSPLRNVLDVTGVAEVIPLHGSVDAARAAWGSFP